MDCELQKIDTYLNGQGLCKKTYTELSENSIHIPLVTNSRTEAYCFDEVPVKFLPIKFSSADAILLKENLYFIEFKGLAGGRYTDANKYKVVKQNLFLKINESLLVLDKLLSPTAGANLLCKKYFIIVVDTASSPTMALSGAMAGLSRHGRYYNPSTFPSIFKKYLQRFNGTSLYYDDIYVWNDRNFSINIGTLV